MVRALQPVRAQVLRHEFNPLYCSPQSAGQVGAGVNMAVRRDVVLSLGGFDERLDAGTPARSGGDHESLRPAARTRVPARVRPRSGQLASAPAHVARAAPDPRRVRTGVYAMWTGRVIERGELAVVRQAARWFFTVQLPQLVKSLARRPDAMPRNLVLAELTGCVKGPIAWLASARTHRRPNPA